MKTEDGSAEMFREFKDSFSYGSRTDLNFKFLSGLSEEEAAGFFRDLLWKLGDVLDDGNFGRIIDFISMWQRQAYSGESQWIYDSGPFTPFQMPLSEAKIALVTSSGHFVKNDDPEPFGIADMTQEEANTKIDEFLRIEPTLSSIPTSTPNEALKVRHPGYDIRGAYADPNVAFPLERLRELHRDGIIGPLGPNAYSFVGACAQLHLLKKAGPRWVGTIHQECVDAVLLVPV